MMTFGDALEYLKYGDPERKITRTGWNGKGMWVALQRPDEHSKMKLPYLYMSTASGELVPWLASQTDMLADDWDIFAAAKDIAKDIAKDTTKDTVEDAEGNEQAVTSDWITELAEPWGNSDWITELAELEAIARDLLNTREVAIKLCQLASCKPHTSFKVVCDDAGVACMDKAGPAELARLALWSCDTGKSFELWWLDAAKLLQSGWSPEGWHLTHRR